MVHQHPVKVIESAHQPIFELADFSGNDCCLFLLLL
jgi:hypothetical protein